MNRQGDHHMLQSRSLTCIRVVLAAALCVTIGARAEDGAWQSKAAAGLSIAQGNSDTMSLSLELTAGLKAAKNETSLGAAFAYGETDSSATEDNAKAFAHYSRLTENRIYMYVNCDIGYDSIASLDYRLVMGPGLGYHLLKDDTQELKIELGASYVSEKIRDGSGSDAIAVRVMQRYDRTLSKTAKLWETVEYLPEADNPDAFLLSAELGIETTISSKLSLRILIQDRYDSDPAVGVAENDVSARMALVYSLGT